MVEALPERGDHRLVRDPERTPAPRAGARRSSWPPRPRGPSGRARGRPRWQRRHWSGAPSMSASRNWAAVVPRRREYRRLGSSRRLAVSASTACCQRGAPRRRRAEARLVGRLRRGRPRPGRRARGRGPRRPERGARGSVTSSGSPRRRRDSASAACILMRRPDGIPLVDALARDRVGELVARTVGGTTSPLATQRSSWSRTSSSGRSVTSARTSGSITRPATEPWSSRVRAVRGHPADAQPDDVPSRPRDRERGGLGRVHGPAGLEQPGQLQQVERVALGAPGEDRRERGVAGPECWRPAARRPRDRCRPSRAIRAALRPAPVPPSRRLSASEPSPPDPSHRPPGHRERHGGVGQRFGRVAE